MLEWTRKCVEVGRERDVRDGRRGIRREKQSVHLHGWNVTNFSYEPLRVCLLLAKVCHVKLNKKVSIYMEGM